MVSVTAHHLPDHPLGVESVRGVREVHLLPGAPADPVPRRRLGSDLWITPGQPHRDGVGRRTQDYRYLSGMGASRTGSSQSSSNRQSSGSQVDQTDSPTRITEKPAFAIRSKSASI